MLFWANTCRSHENANVLSKGFPLGERSKVLQNADIYKYFGRKNAKLDFFVDMVVYTPEIANVISGELT